MNKSELVQIVVSRAGISSAQAEKAVDVVVDQLQAHLPGPVADQVKNLLGGGAQTVDAGSIAKGLGGMFKK